MLRRFYPSARATNWLLTLGFLSLGYAFYLRYLVIEQSTVGQMCDAGAKTWLCTSRMVAMGLFTHQVFGWIGFGAAVLTLLHPTLLLFAIALATASFGLVLYNTALAGLAAGILILCLARPAREPE
jgi:hypothetical protein